MNAFADLGEIKALNGYEFESACRFFCNSTYLGDHIAVCRVLTRHRLYVDTRDTGITPHLINDGFWETWLTQCLARVIRPGDTCIDIGANVGYYSVLMAGLAGAAGQTIAVEPNPAIASLLRQTAELNQPSFKVAEVALAADNGMIDLYIPGQSFGDASILQRPDRRAVNKSTVKVKMMSLDALLDQMNISKVDVIKMDVEGAEPQVFYGMKKTMANNPGLKIIIEYSPFLYNEAKEFTEFLFREFTVYRIKDVVETEILDPGSVDRLLELTDHTDLYLVRKHGLTGH